MSTPLQSSTDAINIPYKSIPRAWNHTRRCPHPAIIPNIVPTSVIVGRSGGIALQHLSSTPQNDSTCSAVKHMSGMGGAPRHGRTPRKMSSVTARSLRRCGYGRSFVATYDHDQRWKKKGVTQEGTTHTSRQTQANENTSLSRVTGHGTPSSSSTRERISSGAIHRVDPASNDVPSWAARKVASVSESSSTTVDSPKSEISAFPSSLMRMLVWRESGVSWSWTRL